MPIFWRRPAAADASEVASHAAAQSGGVRLTTIISALALVFSGYSLW
jgi:hypothetical protein